MRVVSGPFEGTHPEVPAGPTPVILMEDLQIDRYTSGTRYNPQAVSVRITHKPTCLVVAASHQSSLEATRIAMERLRNRLALRDTSHTSKG